jgi:hypothetical protein
MRDIKVSSIPDCDICKKPDGIYDLPTAGIGSPWANHCEECAKSAFSHPGVFAIGSKKILRIVSDKKASDAVLIGKELTSMEALVNDDEQREVECPACGESRTVEPDATYTFICEGCNAKVRCKCIM